MGKKTNSPANVGENCRICHKSRQKFFPTPLRKTRSRLFLSFPTDTLPFVILSKHGVAVRIEGSLKTILEKGKTALLPFSPYSEELHAERVKPPHFYSKLFSKNGKITLLPFFPYEHTDGGECAARFIKGVPCNARRRGEKPPPVWRANLRANARQVSPLLSTISFVSSKEIVRTKFCIHKYNHPSQSRCRCR